MYYLLNLHCNLSAPTLGKFNVNQNKPEEKPKCQITFYLVNMKMAVQEMLLQTEPTCVKKSQQNTAGNSFPAMLCWESGT